MLNLIQHLTRSRTYETLKQVQGDKLGLFTRLSFLKLHVILYTMNEVLVNIFRRGRFLKKSLRPQRGGPQPASLRPYPRIIRFTAISEVLLDK
jgi:hypothetical protein